MEHKTKKVIDSTLQINVEKIELQKKNNKIGELVIFAQKDAESEYKEINFGVIPNFQAQEINKNTGIKINGATKVLSSFAIKHIIKKHGSGSNQEERGQKTIAVTDFELIPLILKDPDVVSYVGKNSKGKESILFKKRIDAFTYFVAMAVAYKKNNETKKEEVTLFVNTMYAKK
jgi:hypothetical protein